MSQRPGRVLVVTGAGISAESGIPTFRGKDGYWRNLDPVKLATVDAFRDDPETIWQWYRERRAHIRASEPNAAHRAVVKLAAHARDFLLLTQNVDDLHLRAEWGGRTLSNAQIVQIHGDIFVTRCTRCDFARRERESSEAQGVPVCPRCGGLMRPGVVWFDEELDSSEVGRVEDFLSAGTCDVVLVVGTTASFDYILRWPRRAAGAKGRLIEVNPEPTPLSAYATEAIRARAAEALPALIDSLLGR